MVWYFGLVLCMGKTENHELSKFETDILMYLVVVVDPLSPVPGTEVINLSIIACIC